MSAALLAEDGSTSHAEMPDLEMVRDAAISIYNQCLSEKVSLSGTSSVTLSTCFTFVVVRICLLQITPQADFLLFCLVLGNGKSFRLGQILGCC